MALEKALLLGALAAAAAQKTDGGKGGCPRLLYELFFGEHLLELANLNLFERFECDDQPLGSHG